MPTEQSRQDEHFRTANGERIPNEGDRTIVGKSSDGELLAVRYAVADVTVPLDSVAQMCDAGAVVVFTAKGGYVNGPKGHITFERKDDGYVRKTRVRSGKVAKTNQEAKPKTPSPQQEVDKDGDVEMNRVSSNPKTSKVFPGRRKPYKTAEF